MDLEEKYRIACASLPWIFDNEFMATYLRKA